jgi:hypothetical protein
LEQLKVQNAYSDVLNGCVLRGVVSVCDIVGFVRVLLGFCIGGLSFDVFVL